MVICLRVEVPPAEPQDLFPHEKSCSQTLTNSVESHPSGHACDTDNKSQRAQMGEELACRNCLLTGASLQRRVR